MDSDSDLESVALDGLKAELDSLIETSFRQITIAFTVFYASFFALWAFSGGLISETNYLISGGLIIASIGFFGLNLILGILEGLRIIDSISSRISPLLPRLWNEDEGLPPDAFREAIKGHNSERDKRLNLHIVRIGRVTRAAMGFAVAAIIFLFVSFLVAIIDASAG